MTDLVCVRESKFESPAPRKGNNVDELAGAGLDIQPSAAFVSETRNSQMAATGATGPSRQCTGNWLWIRKEARGYLSKRWDLSRSMRLTWRKN